MTAPTSGTPADLVMEPIDSGPQPGQTWETSDVIAGRQVFRQVTVRHVSERYVEVIGERNSRILLDNFLHRFTLVAR